MQCAYCNCPTTQEMGRKCRIGRIEKNHHRTCSRSVNGRPSKHKKASNPLVTPSTTSSCLPPNTCGTLPLLPSSSHKCSYTGLYSTQAASSTQILPSRCTEIQPPQPSSRTGTLGLPSNPGLSSNTSATVPPLSRAVPPLSSATVPPLSSATGEMIGFINLGDINNAILDLQRDNAVDHPPVATHLLTLMVRGVFISLEFPFAHFGTDNLTAGTLFPIVWEGVQRLEEMGFKVIGITADGASHNRKFFRMHGKSNSDSSCIYKTENPFAEEEHFIHFISDPPHLIKTARNCLSHSYGHGYTRKLWVIHCICMHIHCLIHCLLCLACCMIIVTTVLEQWS